MSQSVISLKQHQEIMLNLLKEFDQYCLEHELKYYLTGGTLLGAVRHKGFIPWDDDVDIVMPRPDYEKLIRESFISKDAQVISLENPQGHYHPFAYCNVVDTGTIMIEKNIKRSTNKGIFIDIFPLDGVPDNPTKRKKHLSKLVKLQSLLSNSINVVQPHQGIKGVAKKILGIIMKPFDEMKLAEKVSSLARKYSYNECGSVAHLVLLLNKPKRFITPKEEYEDYVLLDFENIKLRCPKAYDSILKRSYGDYMQLPPESERQGHHGIEIIKLDK